MTDDERARELIDKLRRWADARERRNPNGFGQTGTNLLRDAANAIAQLNMERNYYQGRTKVREP